MTTKHPKRRWIFALAITTTVAVPLVLLGVSVALALLLMSLALVWLALIPEFFDVDAAQKRRYGFGLAVITSMVIVAGYLVQRSESRDLQRELAAAAPRALSEQQVNEWADALMGHAGTAVDVIANGPTTEPIDLSRQIEGVLRDAGWDVKWTRFWHPYSRGAFTSGIEINAEHREGDPDSVLFAARVLYGLIHREFPSSRLIEKTREFDRIQVYVFPKP